MEQSLPYTPAYVGDVEITSEFWMARQECMRTKTLPAVIDNLRTTGRAYALTWTKENAPVKPHPFWDSDLSKTLEACCYFLIKKDDPLLREYVEESVKIVRKAQHSDGYINSYFTIVQLEKRFTNLRDMHELYCLGHLCEAAVAHRLWSGTDDLIEPTMRYVRFVASQFGPEEGKRKGYPGHQELEIGLMRLYELTGDKQCLDLAGFFILERGKTYDGDCYFDTEARARGADPADSYSSEFRPQYRFPRDYAYQQAHRPLLEQETIEGHSVRAMYFLIAATDYAIAAKDDKVLAAVKRLYKNTTRQKMYVTGGIGSIERSEGFTELNYWLPDQEEGGCAYAETCASFALVLLCQRLLRVELNGDYADVMENALYNTVLGAVSTDGSAFYYQNPLTTFAGQPKDRSTWFDCACCPPNVAKIFGLVPEMVYSKSQDDSSIAIHLFLASEYKTTVRGKPVTVSQKTGMPWDGNVEITLEADAPVGLKIRIPQWASRLYSLQGCTGQVVDGYLHVSPRQYSAGKAGDAHIKLYFSCAPRRIFANPRTGKMEVAIARGPLVYCSENVDNPSVGLDVLGIEKGAPLEDLPTKDIAGIAGVRPVKAIGRVIDTSFWEKTGALYDEDEVHVEWGKDTVDVVFVPYFLRQNRGGNGAMRVWHKRT